jgi:hypothetical protein
MMLDHLVLISIICFSAAGLMLIAASFWFLRANEPTKRAEHWARTLVGIGIACVSISVALKAYDLKESGDQQQDRKTASLNFGRAMLLYGLSQAQIDRVVKSCSLDSSGVITDKVGCRESGTLAIKFSSLLPSVDLTFSQIARGLSNLQATDVIRTNLVDSEASLKGLMPASVEILLQATAGHSRTESVVKALVFVDEFRDRADEISTIYCAFAAATEDSWARFSEVIGRFQDIKYKPNTNGSQDRLKEFRNVSKDLKVGSVSCNDVSTGVIDLVPAGGGGD